VGGLERVVVSLINCVDRDRFRPILCCLEREGELANEVRGACDLMAVMDKRPGIAYIMPFRLASLFRSQGVDVVHCHNFGPLVYGSLGGQLAGCRGVVYTVHGPEIPSKRRHVMFQRVARVSRVVTVSDYVRRGAIDLVGLDPAKVTTIVNGIDVGRFASEKDRSEFRSELGVPDGTPLLGIVARLTPEKDHENLLYAFVRVVSERRDARLVIVGSGPAMSGLKRKAAELGIVDSVRFTGTRLDVPNILAALDLFVMTSREEGLGITLLEAMAAGLPVVATAAGGIPEIVVDEVTGYLVPKASPVAFAHAVLRILSDKSGARRMGEEGRKRVAERFSLRRMVGDYEKLYSQLVFGGER